MVYISKILGKVGYTVGRLFRPRYRTVSEEFAGSYDAIVEFITGLRRLAAQTPETAKPHPLDNKQIIIPKLDKKFLE